MTDPSAKKESRQHYFTLHDNLNEKSYELPVLEGTEGPRVIDVRKLYAEAGVFTFDPGYKSTASCLISIRQASGPAM